MPLVGELDVLEVHALPAAEPRSRWRKRRACSTGHRGHEGEHRPAGAESHERARRTLARLEQLGGAEIETDALLKLEGGPSKGR